MSLIGNAIDKLKEHPVLSGIVGGVTFPITLYNFLRTSDDAVRVRFNKICGTSYSRGDEWKALRRSSYERFIPKTGFFRKMAYGMKLTASNAKNAIKSLGPKPYSWFAAQELSYLLAVIPLQVEAGLLINNMGGGPGSSVVLNLLAGSGLSWLGRRIPIFMYVDRNAKLFVNPTEEMCAYAKELERVPSSAPQPEVANPPRSAFSNVFDEVVKKGAKVVTVTAGAAAVAWTITRTVVSVATGAIIIIPRCFEEMMKKFGKTDLTA